MKHHRSAPALAALLLHGSVLQAQVPIGQWQDDFQWQSTVSVVEGEGGAWCATSNGVFKYEDATGEVRRYTKVNALSDVGIQCLGWNAERKLLIVGYRNGNVDVLGNGSAINLPDIKRSSLVGNKGIYQAVCQGSLAYLACGFGIVVMDLERNEVKETWIMGPGGTQLQINGIAFLGDSVYAASESGIYQASMQGANLADFNAWHKRTDVPGWNGEFTATAAFNGKLLVNRRPGNVPDTLYTLEDGIWSPFTQVTGENINALSVSADGLRLIITQSSFTRRYDTQYVQDYYVDNVLGQPLKSRYAVDRSEGGLWIATDGHGLVRQTGNALAVAPNGPANNRVYRMASALGQVYASTGDHASNWSNMYSKDGMHRLDKGTWSTDLPANDPLYATGANQSGGGLNDMLAVVVDPEDGSHAFGGSWDDGVVEFRDGKITAFHNATNSTLQRFLNSTSDTDPVQVGGMAWDDLGNLWVANANCTAPLSVRLKNGNWYSMGVIPELGANTLVADMIVDRNGFKWIVRPRGAGLLLFSDNGTPTDPGDDRAKAITNFEGQGHLPSMDVFSVAEDLDGQVWVGTNKGIAVFYDGEAAFGEEGDAQQILLEQDGNVQILLETEAVTAIAVDGANNKWLGTQSSGLYLVSPDGTRQLQHFTAENSALPSNTVTCLTMEGTSGTLYIGTDQGIMSYRGTATEGADASECATVFPNPVRRDFTGPVAITGLVRGSDVRITDMAGNVVYHTMSNGGQALWPVTDMRGDRVATGVYLVLAIDPGGSSTCNTKVAVVR